MRLFQRQFRTRALGRLFTFKSDVSLNNTTGPLGPETESMQVPTTRIDEELSKEDHVDFVKMDVEGDELNALRGMVSIIQRSQNMKLLVEYASSNAGRTNADTQEFLDFLRKWFAVYKITENSNGVSLEGPIESVDSIKERMCMLWCVRCS